MAFKSVTNYNEEKFGEFFLLRNDGDYADVIFLYQSTEDVLVADVHYIKSADYSGYVHCCGKGCPACAKNIRTQTKLFIPIYNIEKDKIQFFDRTMRFEPQLQHDVFEQFPNPSDYVFRITRHGAAGSVDTTYEIQAVGKNNFKSYAQILVEQNAQMPDYYNNICKEMTHTELQAMLNDASAPTSNYVAGNGTTYTATPRAAAPTPTIPEPPAIAVDQYAEPPVYDPDSIDESSTDYTDEEAEEPKF